MKSRSDSKLKQLPEDRQEQVIAWCNEKRTDTCSGGYAHAQEQLAADGIKVSLRALSEFYSWHSTLKFYEGAAERAEQQKALMLDFDPANVDRAEAFGDYCFLQESLAARDAKTYTTVRNVRLTEKGLRGKAQIEKVKLKQADRRATQKDQEIALQTRKYQRDTCRLFVEWSENQQAKAALASGATNAEKIEALGMAMFGEDWEK